MKKALSILLGIALTAGTLSGCVGVIPTRRQLTPPIELADLTVPAENAQDQAPEALPGLVTESDDYTGFAVFPEGEYLADPMFDTDEYLPDYDIDLSFVQRYSTGGTWGDDPALCATEDTVYYYDMPHSLIMYLDKATGITGPLCARPECAHTDKTCGAYASGIQGIRIYDGKLYWSGGCMELDGTNRRSGRWLADNSGMDNISTAVIHRGYVYNGGTGQTVSGGSTKHMALVYVTDMATGESFNILKRDLRGLGGSCEIRPVGNDLYILIHSFNYFVPGERASGIYSMVEVYRWDSKTRTPSFVFSFSGKDTGYNINSETFMPVPGDGIYLRAEQGDDQIICKFSFETKTIEELRRMPIINGESFIPVYHRDYILLQHTKLEGGTASYRGIVLLDYNGETVLDRSSGGYGFSYFMGMDEDFVYGYEMRRDPGALWSSGTYYMVPLKGGDIVTFGDGPMRT